MKQNPGGVPYDFHWMFPALLLLIVFSAGCGGSKDCSVAVGLAVEPATASADHLAAAPGNQVGFIAVDVLPSGCPLLPGPIRTDVTWSVSDPVNVTIGNTPGPDYGVATCKNATAGAVTVTAAGTNRLNAPMTGTAKLTCN